MVIHYMSLIIRWQLAKTSYSQQSYPFFLTLLCFGAFHFWNADAATFRASKIRKPWVSLGWWSFAFDAQDEGALYEVGFSLLWSFMKPPDGSGGHRGHWLVLRNTIVWHRTRLGYPSNWPPDRFCCSNRRLWWVCHWTLSGCWFQTCFIFHFIYGMSSFPLTNSYFSRWAHCTTNQIWNLYGFTMIETWKLEISLWKRMMVRWCYHQTRCFFQWNTWNWPWNMWIDGGLSREK